MIIGIAGKAGSGKDTVANMIQEFSNNRFQIKRFADELKQMVAKAIDCNAEDLNDQEFKKRILSSEWKIDGKEMTCRELLIRIGDGMRHIAHPDYWVNILFAQYKEVQRSRVHPEDDGGLLTKREYYKALPDWIIPDLRYPNELRKIKYNGGISIQIKRPGINTINHPSETALDYGVFDYTIHNTGDIEGLRASVIAIYNKIVQQITNA